MDDDRLKQGKENFSDYCQTTGGTGLPEIQIVQDNTFESNFEQVIKNMSQKGNEK